MRALCYKSWRESDIRFLLSTAVIVALLVIFLLFQGMFRANLGDASGADRTYVGYIYLRVYGGFVRGTFTFLALILGLGGLQRERAHQSIGFTLALPVSRLELFAARVAIGMYEVAALALLPLVLVPALSKLMGQHFPVDQAVAYAGLWIAVGWALFAFGVLVSTMVRSEYASLTLAVVAFYLYPLVVVRTPILRNWPLHIHYIMNGRNMPYVDQLTDTFVGPYPWTIVLGIAVVTMTLLGAAAKATLVEDLA